MTEETATTTAVVEYQPLLGHLAQLHRELDGRVYDLTTADGEKEARVDVGFCVKLRTTLEAKREGLKRPVLERGRLIDAEAKRIEALIRQVETPIAQQLKVIDDQREVVKQARLAEIAERTRLLRKQIVDNFTVAGAVAGAGDSLLIRQAIDFMECIDCEDMFGDLAAEAVEARSEALAKLAPVLREKMAAEVKAIEETAQRQIAAEKKRVEDAAKLEEARAFAAKREIENAELKRVAEENAAELARLRATQPPPAPPPAVAETFSDPARAAAAEVKLRLDEGIIAVSVQRLVHMIRADWDLTHEQAHALYHGVLGIAESMREGRG